MFYSNYILVKKGVLSHVWLAAHWQRKITKDHVKKTDIGVSVKQIENPTAPLALRLSGQLLLGLVRIYTRKVQYLQDDASDALTKMKIVYRPGKRVDLQAAQTRARDQDITLAQQGGEAAVLLEIDTADMDLEQLLDQQRANLDLDMTQELDMTVSVTGRRSTLQQQQQPQDVLDSLDLDEAELDDLGGLDLGEDLEMPLEESFDLEMPRDAEEAALLEPELSAAEELELDASKLDQSRLSLASGFSKLSEIAKEYEEATPPPAARKPKRKKPAKRDKKTELRSKVITAQLNYTDDIVVEQQEMLPLTKRRRLEQISAQVLQDPLKHPLASFGQLRGEDPLAAVAPELEALMREVLLRKPLAAEEEEEEAFDEEMGLEMARQDELEQQELELAESLGYEEEVDLGPGDSLELSRISLDSEALRRTSAIDKRQIQDMRSMFGKALPAEDAEAPSEGWNQLTKKTLQIIKNKISRADSIELGDIVQGHSRRTAATVFYQLLVLRSHDFVGLEQQEAYGDITISRGQHFSARQPVS